MTGSDPQQSPSNQPIIVREGSSGTAIALIVAAVILGGAAIWAVSIWSNTQMKLIEAPTKVIEKGIDDVKDALKPGN